MSILAEEFMKNLNEFNDYWSKLSNEEKVRIKINYDKVMNNLIHDALKNDPDIKSGSGS